MIKPQDCMLLLKIVVHANEGSLERMSQNELAARLCYSSSEVHAGCKRLQAAGLLREKPAYEAGVWTHNYQPGVEKACHPMMKTVNENSAPRFKYVPILNAVEEFLVHGVKYVFPAVLGEYTRGIPTAIAAPVFKGKIMLGGEPIPVWPYAEGQVSGQALEPLYSSIPVSISKYPDQKFYDLLAVVDTLRQGGARERNLAIQMLSAWFPKEG